jgi:phage-related protein
MFYAKTFIFDDKPSEFYSLYLGEFSGSGDATTSASNDLSLLTLKLFRRPVPLFWGAEQTPVLQFPLSMYSDAKEIDAMQYSTISTWLFAQQAYKKLRICQPDMQDVYFNCFLTAPQVVRQGNIIRGFTTTVTCDAPWGWKVPKYYSYTYNPNSYSISDTVSFLNESANGFYTYPTPLKITANTFGGSVTITNITDNSRVFTLNVLPNEVVTLDCDHQIISSTLVTYPLYNLLNQHWLRLLPGVNTLSISGNVYKIEITTPIAVKVGG